MPFLVIWTRQIGSLGVAVIAARCRDKIREKKPVETGKPT
jgi:hypothetical protein